MNKSPLWAIPVIVFISILFIPLYSGLAADSSEDSPIKPLNDPFARYQEAAATEKKEEAERKNIEAAGPDGTTALPGVIYKGPIDSMANFWFDNSAPREFYAQIIKAFKDNFDIDVSTLDGNEYRPSTLYRIYMTLEKIPSFFRSCVKSLKRITVPSNENFGKVDPGDVCGYVKWEETSNIYFTKLGENSGRNPEATFVHEMGHCYHMQNPQFMNMWQNQFWNPRNAYDGTQTPKGPEAPVSDYGHTNAFEDFADAIRYYILVPDDLKKSCPQRYEIIKKYVMRGYEF